MGDARRRDCGALAAGIVAHLPWGLSTTKRCGRCLRAALRWMGVTGGLENSAFVTDRSYFCSLSIMPNAKALQRDSVRDPRNARPEDDDWTIIQPEGRLVTLAVITKRHIACLHALKSGAVATTLPMKSIGSVGAAGISGCLLVAASAFALPPPDADMTLAPWFRSLKEPSTKNLCCDMSDCRNCPVRPDGTQYQVFFDNRWLSVPAEAVSDRTDNPTGNYVTCIQRDHWSNGVPDGPRVLCLFKAPGT